MSEITEEEAQRYAHQAFMAWNEVRAKYALGPLTFSKANIARFETFARWCIEHEIPDFRIYMRAVAYDWTRRKVPLPAAEKLCSLDLRRRLDDVVDVMLAEEENAKLVDEAKRRAPVEAVNNVLCLIPSREAYKARVRGTPDVCMQEANYSGGFHPQSEPCRMCPLGGECHARITQALGIDRRQWITWPEPRVLYGPMAQWRDDPTTPRVAGEPCVLYPSQIDGFVAKLRTMGAAKVSGLNMLTNDEEW